LQWFSPQLLPGEREVAVKPCSFTTFVKTAAGMKIALSLAGSERSGLSATMLMEIGYAGPRMVLASSSCHSSQLSGVGRRTGVARFSAANLVHTNGARTSDVGRDVA
jgi:hypothetical protein